jgi:hypothetical protein
MHNPASLDQEEVHLELHLAIGRLRQKRDLIRTFFIRAGLEQETIFSKTLRQRSLLYFASQQCIEIF